MKKVIKKILKHDNIPTAIGFIIPLLFFFIISIMYCIYPLSNKALVPYDAQHQYVPFLQELRTKLLNGEDFFFSRRMASSDFYTEWLYYLTSPFNLLVILSDNIILVFQIIIALKAGCIGASMAAYLKKAYGNNGIYTAVFACSYSMSAYVMSYYFSIMWLDILIIFPWLIYFFHKMLDNEMPCVYSLFLALVIFSNFFMAMHVCIFLCLYFVIQGHESVKELFKKGIRFSFYSILGGGISAVFFIPFFNIAGDKADRYPGSYILTDFVDVFMSFGALAEKQVSMDYSCNANLYCGVITLILFSMYLFNSKFNKIERMRNAIIVGFIVLCTNISDLDYFFNGFYKTNGYMGRYTYILIFFVVCCAYKEFISVKNEKRSRKIIVSVCVAFLFAAGFTYLSSLKKIEEWEVITSSLSFIICLLFIFVSCTSIFKRKTAICFILMVELIFTGANKIKCSDMGMILETSNDISVIFQDTDARQSILEESIHNEEILNNINGVSLFSSSLPKEVSRFQYKVGLRGGSNYTTAYGCELFPSLLYNIQYIYGTDDEYMGFTKTDESGSRKLFKNNYDTYYAYVVPDSLINWKWDTTNTFNNINAFISFFTDKKLFTIVNEDDVKLEGDYGSYSHYYDEYGSYKVRFNKGAGSFLEACITAEKPEVAVKVNNGYFNKCTIYINDRIYIDDKDIEGDIVYVKGVKKGDIIRVRMDFNKNEGTAGIMFAYYDMDAYKRFADEFSSRGFDVKFDGNKITGYYETEENESILLSVPAIDGWEIKESGNIVEKKDFPLIMFKTKSNSGSFEAHYTTPLFKGGFCITIFSCIILTIISVFKFGRKNKQLHQVIQSNDEKL